MNPNAIEGNYGEIVRWLNRHPVENIYNGHGIIDVPDPSSTDPDRPDRAIYVNVGLFSLIEDHASFCACCRGGRSSDSMRQAPKIFERVDNMPGTLVV